MVLRHIVGHIHFDNYTNNFKKKEEKRLKSAVLELRALAKELEPCQKVKLCKTNRV